MRSFVDDRPCLVDDLVGGADHALGLGVELEDPRVGVAFQADRLHVPLAALVVWPPVRDRGEEVVGEPLRGVVRGLDLAVSVPSSPLMWQVAQVGTGMSAVVSLSGFASGCMLARWALKSTPCLDSW